MNITKALTFHESWNFEKPCQLKIKNEVVCLRHGHDKNENASDPTVLDKVIECSQVILNMISVMGDPLYSPLTSELHKILNEHKSFIQNFKENQKLMQSKVLERKFSFIENSSKISFVDEILRGTKKVLPFPIISTAAIAARMREERPLLTYAQNVAFSPSLYAFAQDTNDSSDNVSRKRKRLSVEQKKTQLKPKEPPSKKIYVEK